MTRKEKIVPKHIYFCHSIIEFLATVDRERGWEGEEQEILIQGDTGQGFLKLAVSKLRVVELEKSVYTRHMDPGLVYQETEVSSKVKKKRRTQDVGVSGGEQFQD